MSPRTEHICMEGTGCRCSVAALEPNEDCPVHSAGPWPPRCETCGKFLPWSVREGHYDTYMRATVGV